MLYVVAIHCPDSEAPNHAVIDKPAEGVYMDEIEVECDEDGFLFPDGCQRITSRCSASGHWSKSLEACLGDICI